MKILSFIFLSLLSLSNVAFSAGSNVISNALITGGTASNLTITSGTLPLYGLLKTGSTGLVTTTTAPLVDALQNGTVIVADGDSLTDTLAMTSNVITVGLTSGTNAITSWPVSPYKADRVFVGATVSGTGIPEGTTVLRVNDQNTVILSKNITVTGTTPVTFTGTCWPTELAKLSACAGGRVTIYNTAVAGTGISGLNARYAANVYPRRPAENGGHRAIYIPFTGSIDIDSTDPFTVLGLLETLWTQAKADGFEVWAVTNPYRNPLGTGTGSLNFWGTTPWTSFIGNPRVENWHNVLNDLIRNSAVPDHVIDMDSQFIDMNYDMVHPSIIGARQQAAYINLCLLTGGDLPRNSNQNIVAETIRGSMGQGTTVYNNSYGKGSSNTQYGLGVRHYVDNAGMTYLSCQPTGFDSYLYVAGANNMVDATVTGGAFGTHFKFSSGTTSVTYHNALSPYTQIDAGILVNNRTLNLAGPSVWASGTMSNHAAIYLPDQYANMSGHGPSLDKVYAIQQTGTNDRVYFAGQMGLKSGANTRLNSITLTSGSAVQANSSITTNSRVFFTPSTISGTVTLPPIASCVTGTLSVAAGADDNSTYTYFIIEAQ